MTIDDLIADWKQMRTTFVSHLEILESGRIGVSDSRTVDAIAHLKRFVVELDAMIGEQNPPVEP